MKKTVLITGASRGIGAATARHLSEQGYNVCINYKSSDQAAAKLASELKEKGVNAIAVRADVSDEASVIELFRKMDEALGPVTALVNNAAILMPQTRVDQMNAERVNRILKTNITGYFICCREAVKRMSKLHGGQGGAIVNVSSVASQTGSPNEYVDYAASKGAVDALTRGLSVEVAGEGIRVNAVRPGFIYTEMHADGGEPGRVDRIKSQLPMQRGGEPEEVAAAIGWLLSEAASYVTGTFIELAGGK